MLDFACALYLGQRHASDGIRPWTQLTSGRPAALDEPLAAKRLGAELAALIGCESAIIAPSTLHLFWDIFGLLSALSISLYLDADSYPIARWGVERAMARGMPVRRFPGHKADVLRRLLLQDDPLGLTPVVVADGISPATGRPAPVGAYLQAVRSRAGYLVLDDTQALGILGSAAGPDSPYGTGGGGTLRYSGISTSAVVVIASLAKGFGVPMAVLAGSSAFVDAFKQHSATRVHCSPPSMALIHSAENALEVNAISGEFLRQRLARSILHFRKGLAMRGLAADGGLFPVQTLCSPTGRAAEIIYKDLLRRGIKTVPQRLGDGKGARLSFIITARHSLAEIDLAIESIAEALEIMPTFRR